MCLAEIPFSFSYHLFQGTVCILCYIYTIMFLCVTPPFTIKFLSIWSRQNVRKHFDIILMKWIHPFNNCTCAMSAFFKTVRRNLCSNFIHYFSRKKSCYFGWVSRGSVKLLLPYIYSHHSLLVTAERIL